MYHFFSIVSEIFDQAVADNADTADDNHVRSVFLGILRDEQLDMREKKSAIIDFISAGIETVIVVLNNLKIIL